VQVTGGQVLTAVLVATILGVTASLLHGAGQLRQLRGERQQFGEQTVLLLKQNRALRDEAARLKQDDLYLESLARRELGLVRPNEVVYHFRRPPRQAQ
jgi:cell division protein FtsB